MMVKGVDKKKMHYDFKNIYRNNCIYSNTIKSGILGAIVVFF